MKLRSFIVLVAALALPFGGVTPAVAQPASPQSVMPTFSQPELDQMVAPIALYPDPLLSQVLMAASYPLEVVEAARWSREHPRLSGAAATNAVAGYPWDPSVKSLVAFPQILAKMDANLPWTERLGDAFLAQPSQVMDSVQNLRQRASVAGNLRSNNYYSVRQNGPYYDIGWVDPASAYVPYYDPTQVYGPWAYAAYPPVFWSPWPGYRVLPGLGAFLWGPRIFVGSNFFFGGFDWPHHHARVWNIANRYHPSIAGVPSRGAVAWQHDPGHRRGAPYRDAGLTQRFGRTPASAVAAARSGPRATAAIARAETHVPPAARVAAHSERRAAAAASRPAAPRFQQHAQMSAPRAAPRSAPAPRAAPAPRGGGGGHPHGGGGHGHDKK